MAKIGKLIFLMFTLLALPLHAADVNVTAGVDRNEMRPGDTFTYTVSVTSNGSVSFDKPRLPDLSGFEIINSWSGSEMHGTFANGQVQTQKSQTFNYMLSATRVGNFTIAAAEVVVNGQLIRTNPIHIKVSNSAPQAPSQMQQPGGSGVAPDDLDDDDIFSQLLRRRLHPNQRGTVAPADINDAYFIQVEVDKKKVYQGEQIIASWYLVTRSQIADIDTLKYPSLDGFWKEDIEVATRLNFRPEIINGIPYQKALLASYALFPIKVGEATIDPYQAKCRIVGFNPFGLPQDKSLVKSSSAVKIEVMPLPDKEKHAAFSGGVGDFSVSDRTDVTTVKANSPITLKVRVEGRGNAKMIDLPKLNLPGTVQVYDTKSEMKFYPDGKSYKEFETLLVPKEPGQFEIPPISFTFFNPVSKSYYERQTSPIAIHVDPGEPGTDMISSGQMALDGDSQKKTEPVLPGLILTLEPDSLISKNAQLGIWGGAFTLTFLGLIGFAYKQVGQEQKKEDLRKRIQNRISEIENELGKGNWRKVGIETTNLIYAVLGEISEQGGAAFDFDKLVEKAPPSFKRELAPQLKDLMTKMEVLGFAPDEVVGKLKEKSEMKQLLVLTKKLLSASARFDFTSSDKSKA